MPPSNKSSTSNNSDVTKDKSSPLLSNSNYLNNNSSISGLSFYNNK